MQQLLGSGAPTDAGQISCWCTVLNNVTDLLPSQLALPATFHCGRKLRKQFEAALCSTCPVSATADKLKLHQVCLHTTYTTAPSASAVVPPWRQRIRSPRRCAIDAATPASIQECKIYNVDPVSCDGCRHRLSSGQRQTRRCCLQAPRTAADIEREQEAILMKKYGGMAKKKLLPKVYILTTPPPRLEVGRCGHPPGRRSRASHTPRISAAVSPKEPPAHGCCNSSLNCLHGMRDACRPFSAVPAAIINYPLRGVLEWPHAGSQVLRLSGLGAPEARRQDRHGSSSGWAATHSAPTETRTDLRKASKVFPPRRGRGGGLSSAFAHLRCWMTQHIASSTICSGSLRASPRRAVVHHLPSICQADKAWCHRLGRMQTSARR